MFKKAFALLLCFVLMLGTLAACSKDENAGNQLLQPTVGGQAANQTPTQTTTNGNDATEPTESEPADLPVVPADPTMGNPDTVMGAGVQFKNTLTCKIYDYNANGIVYRQDNKYGILSRDGKHDSGAIYVAAENLKGYFIVRTAQFEDPKNVATVNIIGLVDANGKEIIPAKYALIKAIDDRFVRAITVTETTESDDYLMYMTSSVFSMSAGEGDTRYLGNWCVYDLQTGKEVPGVTGTTAASISTYGDILSYTENGVKIRKTADGVDIPEDATLFEDGSYITDAGDAVYESNGTKRFDVDLDGFEISSMEEGYYRLVKYEAGTSRYAVADKTGKLCSAIFDKYMYIEEGGLISKDGKLYDMQGNVLFEKEYKRVTCYKGYWMIEDKENNVYFMDSSYKVELACQTDDDTVSAMHFYFVVEKDLDKDEYYSITKKTFVVGDVVEPGIVQRETSDNEKELINVLTDDVLLSGYERYKLAETAEGYWIYAAAGNDVYDVFFFA